MASPISDEIDRLVRSLFVRGQDDRVAVLAQIAASGEVRVVPDLMPLLAVEQALVPHLARAVAQLVREVTPGQLSWLDERVRRGSYAYYASSAWQTLAPGAVAGVARASGFEPSVVGLLASHANGFVRAAALEVLGQQVDGREIPFLSLRANDWVEPVAARARELLLHRLRPDHRHAVLAALPFVLRMFRQRRRDHGAIEQALRDVLLSDGGDAALAQAQAGKCATPVRRMLYELLVSGTEAAQARIIEAALGDADGVIRLRAIRRIAANADFERGVATLERFLREDPVPAVRRLCLSIIAEQLPQRLAGTGVFPDVLLDRAASVRALARFVIGTHRLPLVPRDVYVEHLQRLAGAQPRQMRAAIAGLGETGTRADADLVAPFLDSPLPRQRRAALQALARLDVDRAIASAIAALADDAGSVRAVAIDILSNQAHQVDFDRISVRVRVRRDVLRLLVHAPKWEAAALLLESLVDPTADEEARRVAARLLDRWVEQVNRSQTQPTAQQLARIRARLDDAAPRLSKKTSTMLRFVVSTSD